MATRMSLEDLMKVTNFSRPELELLSRKFSELCLHNEKIDRAKFRDLLADTFEVDDSLLMDRVFRCFDVDADNYIAHDEFMKGMSVFLKGRYEERMKFCFRVYDLNGDRYISKEEMFQMLKNCLVKGAEEDEDGVKDLVDLVLKKLDEDRDGRVSEADWTSAITKESLLMEAFGPCLPTAKTIERYLDLGQSDPKLLTPSASTVAAVHAYGRDGLGLPPPVPKLPSTHVHPHANYRPKRVTVAPAANVPIVMALPKPGAGHPPPIVRKSKAAAAPAQ